LIRSSQLHVGLAKFLAALVMALLLAAPRQALAQISGPYTLVKLQYPGAIYTDATGISNSGVIVGTYRDDSNNVHAYKYESGVYTNVDYPGSAANYGMGIAAGGQVLGTYGMAVEGPYHAFILDHGTYTTFDFPGMETDARMMNASGKIVGAFNAGGTTVPHGYLKDGDTFTQIDYPGSIGTETWGINDAGVISGNYFDNTGIHGFMYAGGVYTAINYPFSSLTRVTRTNNLNRTVGWHAQGSKTLGFVVSGSTYRTVSFDDADSTVVADINDAGQIAGRVDGPDCPGGCGFIATPTAGAPLCNIDFSLNYAGNTLTLNFNGLTASKPTTWQTYLYFQNTVVPLWSTSLPAVTTPISFALPLAGFPRLGPVFGISVFSTPSLGIVCADLPFVNTFP
jgi:probable HAF family extracellular repeat protein